MSMTDEEFAAKQTQALEGIHPTLASTLRMQAYERGHSAGREEVLGILIGLVYDFRPVNDLLMKERP